MIAEALQHRGVVGSTFVQHDTPDARLIAELLAQRIVLVFIFVAAPPVFARLLRACHGGLMSASQQTTWVYFT